MSGLYHEKPKADHKLNKLIRRLNRLSDTWSIYPDTTLSKIFIAREVTTKPYVFSSLGRRGISPFVKTLSVTREELMRFMDLDISVLPMLLGSSDEYGETVDSILARARLQLGI